MDQNWDRCPACKGVTWAGTGPERAAQGIAHIRSAEHSRTAVSRAGLERIAAYWSAHDTAASIERNQLQGLLW